MIALALAAGYCASVAVFRHTSGENVEFGTAAGLLAAAAGAGALERAGMGLPAPAECALALALALLTYVWLVRGPYAATRAMDNQVVVITGANTGIGFETAQELARRGAHVVMACRSADRAEAARARIEAATGVSPRVMLLDVSSLASVRAFGEAFRALGLPLHCLVNNAGVMMAERRETVDGFEMTIAANHLGHFLLVSELLPLLKQSRARVVNLTSSLSQTPKRFEFDDLMCERPNSYTLFGAYGRSKLANVLFTKELARRHPDLTALAVHPGLVLTDVTRNMPLLLRLGERVFHPISALLRKSAFAGAQSSLWAICEPAAEAFSGSYVEHCRPARGNPAADDEAAAARLWEESVALTDQK